MFQRHVQCACDPSTSPLRGRWASIQYLPLNISRLGNKMLSSSIQHLQSPARIPPSLLSASRTIFNLIRNIRRCHNPLPNCRQERQRVCSVCQSDDMSGRVQREPGDQFSSAKSSRDYPQTHEQIRRRGRRPPRRRTRSRTSHAVA